MPNGQTDVFRISQVRLLQILEANLDSQVLGLEVGIGGWRPFQTKDVFGLVNEFAGSEIQAEVQDHETYILHIGPNWEYWFQIGPDSQMYEAMRVAHNEVVG